MKWPWTRKMPNDKQRQLLEEVREERGKLANTAIKLERATFDLDELVRRSIVELNNNRGSAR